MVSAQYKGPLPPPAMLSQYAQVVENAPERIMAEFEKNSDHIREMEKGALRASVSSERRAQWMSFFVLMLILAVVVYALSLGNTAFAGVGGLAFLGLSVKAFLSKK